MTTKQTTSRQGDGDAPAEIHTPCRDQFDSLAPAMLVERYRAGAQRLDMRVIDLSDEQLDYWFDPAQGLGLWSCRALLTHLMDAEMLFAMRLRRMIVEENPVFENFDEQAFIESRFSCSGADSLFMPTGALVASIYTTRQTTATWLVQLSPEDWGCRGMSPSLGEVTARQILVYAAWHLEHHAAYLNAKVAEMIGPIPEQPDQTAGGCGGGCTCAQGDDTKE